MKKDKKPKKEPSMLTYRQRLALALCRKQNQRPGRVWDGKGGTV